MDAQGVSTETPLLYGIIVRTWRRHYTNRLQWFRFGLGFVVDMQIVPNIGKLHWHFGTGHTPSLLPDLLACILCLAARVTWLFLFRNPDSFLHFKRRGKVYRWVVCGTVALTTLPNSLVHIWALKMALTNDAIVSSGVVGAISALIALVPEIGLACWMAWHFLLGRVESHEEFAPIAKNSIIVTGGGRHYSAHAGEPYADNAWAPQMRTAVEIGYLSQAYEEQRLIAQVPSPDRGSDDPRERPQPEQGDGREVEDGREAEEPEQPLNESSNATSTDAANPPRCRTTARFDYMPQSNFGPHSWFSYPLISLSLSAFATIYLIGLPIWIHEDRSNKLAIPPPTLKTALYLPLGLYMLSFYALKHRPRASLFETVDIPLPAPWKTSLTSFPSWKRPVFKNLDTGEITMNDPRRRAFPLRADHHPPLIRTREYMAAYNASPGDCTTFWGHSGRNMKTDIRFRPTIYRIGFVVIAALYICKGFWNTVIYNVPNPYREILRHPKTIKEEDVTRIIKIIRLWLVFSELGKLFILPALVFAGACIGCIFILWSAAIWKYIPREERERMDNMAREFEQAAREERIRVR